MIEVEMTRKLFANQDDMYVEMDEEQYLLKADKLTTARYYGEFIKTGVMSINEVRKYLEENQECIEDFESFIKRTPTWRYHFSIYDY